MRLGVGTVPTDESIHPCVLAKALEERGFESLVVADHSHIPSRRATPFPAVGGLSREYYQVHDPFVALTAAAIATSELIVGSRVLQNDAVRTTNYVDINAISYSTHLREIME